MKTYELNCEQIVPRSVEEVFPFFADAGNLDRLTPAFLRFEIVTPLPVEMRVGLLLDYRLRYRGFPVRWQTRIEAWEPNVRFIDTQLKGPYRLWHHTHEFEPVAEGTKLVDRVRYALPLGPLGRVAHRLSVRGDVERIFAYRRERIAEIFGEVRAGRGTMSV
jgi:ligand-binding SRPBCC domain-containing protein